MKRTHKAAAAIIAALSLGFAAAAVAHSGQMGGGMGHQMKGGMGQGGMGQGGMGHGGGGMHGGQSLMTPEERSALQEKMRNAKTPEERQQIAQSMRDEMQKRAKEKDGAAHTH